MQTSLIYFGYIYAIFLSCFFMWGEKYSSTASFVCIWSSKQGLQAKQPQYHMVDRATLNNWTGGKSNQIWCKIANRTKKGSICGWRKNKMATNKAIVKVRDLVQVDAQKRKLCYDKASNKKKDMRVNEVSKEKKQKKNTKTFCIQDWPKTACHKWTHTHLLLKTDDQDGEMAA